MAKINDILIPSVTLEEILSDGSTLTNPAADHRRLFLGEDGALHLRDSSGTVTDISGSAGSVATDTIWDAAGDLAVGSGANTASKLTKGADGGVLAMGNGAVIWNAGTSFPASKATNDRYFRTDLGMEFFWDGTQWRSLQIFTSQWAVQSISASGQVGATTGVYQPTYSVFLLDFRGVTYVGTTNNGSNYYTVYKKQVSNDSTVASFSTVADSANTYTGHVAAINAASTEKGFYAGVTKTSSPGTAVVGVFLSYQIIAT